MLLHWVSHDIAVNDDASPGPSKLLRSNEATVCRAAILVMGTSIVVTYPCGGEQPRGRQDRRVQPRWSLRPDARRGT
jgi:hypothetical protein